MTKVLVVEDETMVREGIVDMLLLAGYEVIEAVDGDQAVTLAREELPELIISDIMMPKIDGFELFRILKKDTITAQIPFIFLSALTGYDDIRQGMDLGADDYLTKPFDYHQLTNAVQARLRKHSNEEFLRFRQLAGHLINDHDQVRSEVATVLQEEVLAALNGLYLLQNSIQVGDIGGQSSSLRNLSTIIRNTQAVIYKLQPMLLDQLSVAGTVQWLVLQHEKRHGLEINLQLPAMEVQCTPEGQKVIFHVVDEALLNCAKHSGVKEVSIVVQSLDDSCRVEIRDHGVGLDLASVQEGVGIQRIREQARLIGAFVHVASTLGHGTKVTLHLPQYVNSSKPKPMLLIPHSEPSAQLTVDQTQGVPVIIADDHDVVSEGLANVIHGVEGFHVAATVQTTNQLYEAIKRFEPHIVIIDATFERSNGLEVMHAIKSLWPKIRIIVLSPYDDAVYANEVLRQGVNGFLLRNVRRREVANALEAVISDTQYVSPELQEDMLLLRRQQSKL